MICPLLVSSDAHAVVGSTPIPIPGRSLPSTATGRTDDRVECSLEVASPRRLSAARSRASVILLGVGLAMRPPSACNLLGSSPNWTTANPRHARSNSHAADRKRLESTLPDMAGRMVMAMVTTNVSGEQPLHEVAEVSVVSGPNHQMEVVGHQTIGEQTDGRPLPGFVKEFQEGDIIAVFMEHRAASVATIQDVVAITTLRSSTGARHRGRLSPRTTSVSSKK